MFNPSLKIRSRLPGTGGILTKPEKERGGCWKPTENPTLGYPGIIDCFIQ